mmetsp:Transcript_22005/g.37757  ORF Transcript_22005/g.37757 Transcript_22005/m.37757 type:complete len:268 (+) Transcript_22005:1852-2655(+)
MSSTSFKNRFNSDPMCFLSNAAPWKAELEYCVANKRARIWHGWHPGTAGSFIRSWQLDSVSNTIPIPPAPKIIPDRRLSKGQEASSTASFVVAAPNARNPEPSHGRRVPPEPLSPATTTTLCARPEISISCAIPMAWVVPAHAAFVCVFGPRHPASCANCAFPRTSTRNRNLRSNSYGPDDAVEQTLASSLPFPLWFPPPSISLTRDNSRANAASSSSPSSRSGDARRIRFRSVNTSLSALCAPTVLDCKNRITSPTAASIAGKLEA